MQVDALADGTAALSRAPEVEAVRGKVTRLTQQPAGRWQQSLGGAVSLITGTCIIPSQQCPRL